MSSGIIIKKMEFKDAQKHGIVNWPSWQCEPQKFNWVYGQQETAYILEGEVEITTEEGEKITIEPNTMVSFPRGIECTWNVKKTFKKLYRFNYPIKG